MTTVESPLFVDAPPKASRVRSQDSKWKPIFDVLAEHPDQWAQISEPTTSAHATASNLRGGNVAGVPGYDRAQVTVNGETLEFPVPGAFEVVSVTTETDEEGNKLGTIYARAISDETRKARVSEIKDQKRELLKRKQKERAEESAA